MEMTPPSMRENTIAEIDKQTKDSAQVNATTTTTVSKLGEKIVTVTTNPYE